MPKFEVDEEVIYDATIGGVYPVFHECVVFGISESPFNGEITYAIHTKEMGFCHLVSEDELIKKEEWSDDTKRGS